jgi:hypothetical protein
LLVGERARLLERLESVSAVDRFETLLGEDPQLLERGLGQVNHFQAIR